MNTKNEMWSHEGSTLEFRQGYREGLQAAHALMLQLIYDLKLESKINQASWIEVARDWIDDELSMYQVGDEE